MTTITIESNEQGLITVSVNGAEPQPVQNAEEACKVVEMEFGQPDADEQGQGEQEFAGGFNQVRQGGLNSQGPM